MKEQLLYLLHEIVLNPGRANQYNPIWEAAADSNKKKERQPTLRAWSVLSLYTAVATLYALALLVIQNNPNSGQILERAIILLGIGLVLGFFNLTLGLVMMVGLGVINILSTFTWPSDYFNSFDIWLNRDAWLFILPLLLATALHLEKRAINPTTRNLARWGLFILALAVALAAIVYLNLSTDGLPIEIVWSLMALAAFCSMRPYSTAKPDPPFILMAIVYGVTFIGAAWALIYEDGSFRMPAVTDFLQSVAFSFVIVLAVGVTVAVRLENKDKLTDETSRPERRWLLFAAFVALTLMGYSLLWAFLLALLDVILYPLTASMARELQKSQSWGAKLATCGLTALIVSQWVVLLGAGNGILKFISFFVIALPESILANPLWLLFGGGLILSISGRHWTTWLVATFALFSFYIFTGQPNDMSAFSVFILIAAIAFLGLTRLLLWPFLSLLTLWQQRTLNRQQSWNTADMYTPISLVESYSWIRPLGTTALLKNLAANKVPADLFSNKPAREKYEKVATGTAFDQIKTFSSLSELATLDQAVLTPPVRTAVQNLKPTNAPDQKNPINRVRQLAQNIAAIQQVIDKKAQPNATPPVTLSDIQTLQALVRLAYITSRPDVAAYWELYAAFPKPLPPEDPPISPDSSEPRRRLSELTQFHLKQINEWDNMIQQIRPVADQLPAEEQQLLKQLGAIGPRLARFNDQADFSTRQDLLNELLQFVTEEPPAEWLVIDPQENKLIKHLNPWLDPVKALLLHLTFLQNETQGYLKYVSDKIETTLQNIKEVEEIPSLITTLEGLGSYREQYGPLIDTTLVMLIQVGREAAAALAFPSGYNRRLGLQDTLDRIHELRSDLSIRFLYQANPFTIPLSQIAEQLHELLFTAPDKGSSTVYRNPYELGNPIRLNRKALFKGRYELAARLTALIRSRSSPTFILFGPRRMGKTSFLLQLPRFLPSETVPVYLSMQGGAGESNGVFFYSLAKAIYNQIRPQVSIRQPQLSEFENYPFTIFNEWLDEAQPLLGRKSLFLTIDEFEVIGRAIHDKKLTIEILANLRDLMQHRENMLLLFAGVQTIDALGPEPASYFISAYSLQLGYLKPADAAELIREPDPAMGTMPEYEAQVINDILQLTHCQPYLIQAICSAIINQANEEELRLISPPILEQAIQHVFDTSFYFRDIWDEAGETGRNLILALIEGPIRVQSQFPSETLAGLAHRHVIHQLNDGRYDIEIPLVRLWVRRQIPTTP